METPLNFGLVESALRDLSVQQVLQEIVTSVLHAGLFSSTGDKLLGRRIDSFDVDLLAWLAAGISSSSYATLRMGNAARLPDNRSLLTYALQKTELSGLFLEFGVFSGSTINVIAAERKDEKIFGFDSFEGLPETWRPGFLKGSFNTSTLPPVADNVELIVGWFDHTLPDFLDRCAGQKVAFLHIDCDLYSSTQCVLSQLKDRIGPGTIIVFDEYFNYPGWELHEFRALQEFVNHTGMSYRYIGVVPSHQQVAIKIIG